MDGIPLIQPLVGDEELENVRDVLDSGYLTQGPYAEELEMSFADRTDVSEAVTVTSCTAGLELALDAFGVGAGDEVIVPAFTYPATANAVVRVGAHPVLVDVDRDAYTISLTELERATSQNTSAIVPVSWGGQPVVSEQVNEIAEECGAVVVEDAACSAGAAYDGQPVGSQFDASVFSFHPRKLLATGEGGIITTNDEDAAQRMRSIKNFGTDPSADSTRFVRADATNYRLSDVLAAIGVAQLEKLDDVVARRRELAHRYTDLLADVEGIDPPTELEDGHHNYQSYAAYVEAGDDTTRDALIEALGERDIESQIGTYALHRTEAFSDAERVGDLETSAALEDNLLTLPIAHEMTAEDQRRVVTTLDEALATVR